MGWKGDPNAFHKVVDGEIAGLTEKGTPVSGDWALINDSEDGNSVKAVQVGNLPGGGGGGGGSRTLLDSATLASDGTISTSGITNAHRDLELIVRGRSDQAAAGDSFLIQVGNTSVDTGANYSFIIREQGDFDSENTSGDDNQFGGLGGIGVPFTGTNADAGHYGFAVFRFYLYSDTSFHRDVVWSGWRRATSANLRRMVGWGVWQNAADEIDIIEVAPDQGTNFKSGSAWALYGID